MIMCLDVGNTQLHGGVFKGDTPVFQFRKTSQTRSSSDEYGVFLRNVLRENDLDPTEVRHISICSVVPQSQHSMGSACQKYFDTKPFFLQAGVKTGLKIKYHNPKEVGADRISNAVAAYHLFPERNVIVVDFGTATTICAISKNKEYLGGVILAGMKMSMEALEAKTAKLPTVEIIAPPSIVGRTTEESIQSGLYYGQSEMVKGVVQKIADEQNWTDENKPIVIGTGGFSNLLSKTNIFDEIISDLALKGAYLALKMNR